MEQFLSNVNKNAAGNNNKNTFNIEQQFIIRKASFK